ncbi:MAG: alpha/beta hydrolase [Spirochaetes bacterium]|nr:alpha/beta hydrolase [Spirochaetota bacterium]
MEIQVGEARLLFETIGTGRPILLIHGYSLDRRMMKACMEPVFARRSDDWQRIYVDLPGMGGSRAPARLASSDWILETLLAFIDALLPGRRFSLMGESYGGYLVRGIVRKRAVSVDGLLLLCPMIVPERQKRDRPSFRRMARDDEFHATIPRELRRRFEVEMVVQTRQTWARYNEEILPALAAGDPLFLRKLHGPRYGFSFDVDALEAPLDKPALFLLGRQDDVVGYRDAWKLIESYPRASFVVLDRAGHCLQIEQESLFTALAGEWLDRVRESPG